MATSATIIILKKQNCPMATRTTMTIKTTTATTMTIQKISDGNNANNRTDAKLLDCVQKKK